LTCNRRLLQRNNMQRFDCVSTRNCRLLQHFGLQRLERNEARNRRLLMHIDRCALEDRSSSDSSAGHSPSTPSQLKVVMLLVPYSACASQYSLSLPSALARSSRQGQRGAWQRRGAWDEWHVRWIQTWGLPHLLVW